MRRLRSLLLAPVLLGTQCFHTDHLSLRPAPVMVTDPRDRAAVFAETFADQFGLPSRLTPVADVGRGSTWDTCASHPDESITLCWRTAADGTTRFRLWSGASGAKRAETVRRALPDSLAAHFSPDAVRLEDWPKPPRLRWYCGFC